MKPHNWNDFSTETREAQARDLLNSPRGYFLLNQALSIAAAVARNGGEESNAEDMEVLAETLFYVDHQGAKFATVGLDDLDSA
jgi:hypothetical protein